MKVEEFSKTSDTDLRENANKCFAQLEGRGGPDRPDLLLEAKFYMDEIERRKQTKVSHRDFILELVIIVLIGLELYYGIVGGNSQLAVLDKLNTSTRETANVMKSIQDAQQATLAAQKESLKAIEEMNAAIQNQLQLNYEVSVDIVYVDAEKRIDIFNRGKTNVFLWGDKLDGQRPTLEKQGRIITPGGSYYILAPNFEEEVIGQTPRGHQTIIPFEVYLQNANGRKSIANCHFLSEWDNNVLRIHTQTTLVRRAKW